MKKIPTEVILLFPNDTQVKITGDLDVMKQIIKRLDGIVINMPITGALLANIAGHGNDDWPES